MGHIKPRLSRGGRAICFAASVAARRAGAAPAAFFVLAVLGVVGCVLTPGGTRLANYPPPPGKTKFLSATDCKTCHPAEYREWRSSMHAYAQTSPVFVAFNAFVAQSTGGTSGTFCVRCHTEIGISQGEGSLIPNNERSAIAMQSNGCINCHAMNTRDGQASSLFRVPIPGDPEPVIYGPFYGHDEKAPGIAPDSPMRLIKAPHKTMYRGYIKNSRLCGACHDVLLPDGTRLEEAFSEWRNSPYARKGITCQNCHMSPEPGKPLAFKVAPIVDTDLFPDAPPRPRTSHTFTGPDYSLVQAFAQSDLGLDDKAFAQHTALLEQQRVTLFKNAATMAVGNPASVGAGQTMHVTVAVTNTGAGHNFPTGFTAERQLWLEVIVTDASGAELFKSGDLDRFGDLRDGDSGPVDDGTAPYDWALFNLEAQFIVHNFRGVESENVTTTNRQLSPVPFEDPASLAAPLMGAPTPVGRIFKRGIPPLQTKTARYRISVPQGVSGPLKLSVRLRYRNLPPHLMRDLSLPELRSKLRIIDVQTYQAQIALSR